jgi:LysM repeat protein
LSFSLILGLAAMPGLHAQVPDPGQAQDSEAAREKLLHAADQLDNIQANSEATKASVDGMKTDIAELKTENAALRQQVSDLQNALDQYKDEQVKSRQKLIDDVAGMIAAANSAKPTRHHKDADPDAAQPDKSASPSTASNLSPPPDAAPEPDAADQPPPKPKAQKGYYHVVAVGETLSMIVTAYRDNGVNTTVDAVRKANDLSADQGVKAGQKLFIPKPGT